MQFFEREGYLCSVQKGPKWLSIDPDTGLLTRKPSRAEVGKHEVVVHLKRTWPYEVAPLKYGKV
jgi:hypothetical protein